MGLIGSCKALHRICRGFLEVVWSCMGFPGSCIGFVASCIGFVGSCIGFVGSRIGFVVICMG